MSQVVRRRIFIVEDQRLIATALEHTLHKLGYGVAYVATTGEDAVRKVAETAPELILMDIQLQGEMDGIEAARIIQAHHDIPVVYLTAHSDMQTITRATSTTPFGFLTKPINEVELRAAIEIALYKRDTERALAEERARRDRDRLFRTALMHAPVPMMLHAEDGRVLAVSDAVVRATGYVHEQLRTSDDWLDLAYGSRASEIRAIIERAFTGNPPAATELPVRIANGETRRWLFSVSEPLVLFDNTRGLVVVAVDVTEQRRAEQALREQDHQKDEFIAMLGHELRNPLAAVRSATELLKLLSDGDPKYSRTRDVLERQTGHMAKLIDDLLDVSGIISGRISIDKETLDLAAIVQEAIDDRMHDLEDRKLALHLDVEPGALWVRGDRVRLAEVFDNLLSNAIKFTEPPGSISVRVKRNDERAIVEVQDTGEGIEPDLLPHIFEPFRQAEQSLDRSAGGLGLGLVLVKSIVELHGGTVAARSEPGEGAVFTVSLPIAVAPEEHAAEADAARAPARVLIVEDNEDAADTLRIVLETLGNEVEVAYDGASAVTLAQRFRPEMVLCDIGLPGGLDGYDVARAIRNSELDTFLVAVTGYGRPEDIRRAHGAGFDVHLTKPIEVARIEELLSQNRAAGTAGA